jgi:predicted ATPase
LIGRIASDPHARLNYFCSPQHTDSAFYPIIRQFEHAAQFQHGDATGARLDKLDTVLARTATPAKDAALIADLLLIANDGRHPTLTLDGQQRRQQTLQVLQTQLDVLAQHQTVLMILEEIHLINPTNFTFLNILLERVDLVLSSSRNVSTGARSILAKHIRNTTVTLNRLGERSCYPHKQAFRNQVLPPGVAALRSRSAWRHTAICERDDEAVLEAGEQDTARRQL